MYIQDAQKTVVNDLFQVPLSFNWAATNLEYKDKNWVITYNHILNSDVVIPEGVILSFEGGSLHLNDNASITGNNTKIIANDVNIISANTILGTWKSDLVWFRWFGATGNGISDDSLKGQQLLDWANDNLSLDVNVGIGKYTLVANGLDVKVSFRGIGGKRNEFDESVAFYNLTNHKYAIKVMKSYLYIQNLHIHGNGGDFGENATCGVGLLLSGELFPGLQNVIISDVTIVHNEYGIRFFGGVWIVNIENANIAACLYDGINLDRGFGFDINSGQKNFINFSNVCSGANGRNGWFIGGCTSINIFECDAENNKGSAFNFDMELISNLTTRHDTVGVTISNCHTETNGRGAIYLKTGAVGAVINYISNLRIKDNDFFEYTYEYGWTNAILFEAIGEIDESSGIVQSCIILNNLIPGTVNLNNLVDIASIVGFSNYAEYTKIGRSTDLNVIKTLCINGYFNAKGVIYLSPQKSENVVSGSTISFPLPIPTGSILRKYKLFCETDSTNYTVLFETYGRDGNNGVNAYTNSLIEWTELTLNSGNKFLTSLLPEQSGHSARIINNDNYVRITITRINSGTYFHIGNLLIDYK